MVFLTFAGIEMALLFSHAHSVSGMARAGARMGAATGTAASDDYDILRAVQQGGKSVGEGAIDRVVIFKATGTNGQRPASCETTSVPGLCNVYTTADLDLSASSIAGKETAWPPSSRQPGVDYVGVEITAKHQYLTGFLGSTRTVRDSVVMQLEPKIEVRGMSSVIVDSNTVSFSPDGQTTSGMPTANSQADVPAYSGGSGGTSATSVVYAPPTTRAPTTTTVRLGTTTTRPQSTTTTTTSRPRTTTTLAKPFTTTTMPPRLSTTTTRLTTTAVGQTTTTARRITTTTRFNLPPVAPPASLYTPPVGGGY